ncbi:PQQ-binding-like beta-propeller repeat protein [Candidatus Pelagibacter bacterium]|nr:PQQ-binding-like beta-propeller repeat protein [Candidatus Pelagibacter bacterium]
MKLYFISIILLLINACSFDNKSGIWTSDIEEKKNRDFLKDFKKISVSEDVFDKIISLENNKKIKISLPINNLKWNDIYFNDENNLKNFKAGNLNQILFQSKKLSRNKSSDYLIFENGNLIINDDKGNIIVYSVEEKKIISKYNFYRKEYKGIKKKLNLYVQNNIIYVSDSVGYLYAFNYENKQLIWAKHYKLPFKSNLKISGNKIICADVNNNLIFFDRENGELLKLIPTEGTTVTNEFVNNISKYKSNIFFLNSYGTLYSINSETMELKWFINLNTSLNLNQSNLFDGSEIINNGSKIVVSSNKKTFIIEVKTGSILKSYNFISAVKPIINNNIGFFVTNNSLLVAINLDDFQILYSKDINLQVAKFLNTKKRNLNFKDIMLLNNEIFIFLENSFILNFENNGKLKEIKKLPSKIYSSPILIDSSILYLNLGKKLIILN